jgi:NADP-reducing hydrogenase subunit HndB
MEPIVQVQIGDSPKVTYGKVTKDIAARIIDEHVLAGEVVKEHVVNIYDFFTGIEKQVKR